uniref:Chemerin-like receptor 1 n=1 Tax=Salvator merianae TaxID=96440 RepID=A0A8D0BRL5_SALMN
MDAANYSENYDIYDYLEEGLITEEIHPNFTTGETHHKVTDFHLSTVQIVAVLVYSITCLLGLLGNGLVIAIIILKIKKSINAIWFLNLAAADFLFNVFMPLNIIYTAMDYHWIFGKSMCKVNSLLLTFNMYTSVFLLTTISVDRCILVVFPVWCQNHRSSKVAWLLCLLVWALGFFMSCPSLVFRDTELYQGNIICFNNFSLAQFPAHRTNSSWLSIKAYLEVAQERHLILTVTRFVVGFIVPMTVITACYTVIILRLKRNRLAKSKKPLRIIFAIILTFFLCWCPYHILHLLETKHHLIPREVFKIGLPIVVAVASSNSCMNPVLYVFMGQDFKKFKMTLLSRLANALSEDTMHSSFPRRSFTKHSSLTEKETILL